MRKCCGCTNASRATSDAEVSTRCPLHRSPRCTATSKRTKLACEAPAVTGWTVCRFHGARGGGPEGTRKGAYRHGQHSAAAVRQPLKGGPASSTLGYVLPR